MKAKKHFSVPRAVTVLSVVFIGCAFISQIQDSPSVELPADSENSWVVGPHPLPPGDLRSEEFADFTSLPRMMEYLEYSSYGGAR